MCTTFCQTLLWSLSLLFLAPAANQRKSVSTGIAVWFIYINLATFYLCCMFSIICCIPYILIILQSIYGMMCKRAVSFICHIISSNRNTLPFKSLNMPEKVNFLKEILHGKLKLCPILTPNYKQTCIKPNGVF